MSDDSVQIGDSVTIAAIDPNGNFITTAGSTVVANPAFSGITIGSTGLTPKEKDELNGLKQEREQANKQIKREKFKQLHSRIRQLIVDKIELDRAMKDIQQTCIPISDREKDLEIRNHPWTGAAVAGVSFDYDFTGLRHIFTDDEIIDMHNDAEAEKILLEEE